MNTTASLPAEIDPAVELSPPEAESDSEIETLGERRRGVYVIDTSVLVHDPHCLTTFRGTTVVIPIFVVMELDDLKDNRRVEVAAAARTASRFISSLMKYGHLHEEAGVHHPELDTTFRITANGEGHGMGALRESDTVRKMDLLILSAALSLQRSMPGKRIVLLSKDVNLRILADFEGLEAEDYNRDRVQPTHMFHGYRYVDDADPNVVQTAYVPDTELLAEDIGLADLLPNEFVICRDGDKERVLRFNGTSGALRPVPRDYSRAAGIAPRNIEQRMALDLLMDPEVRLVSLVGKAGTGKTFLALAAAVAQVTGLGSGGHYDRILLSKPVIPMGKDIGYLPGDFEAKMQPWMLSFFDNLDQLIPTDDGLSMAKGASRPEKAWEHLFAVGQLEVQAIHSIRGRSIPNAFMLIDEAQNLTPHEVKTIITRAADGTKVILSGDPFQVDNHFLDQSSNGLVYVTERLKDSPVTGAVYFTKGERSLLAELAASRL